jgi:hypothetical protein
MTRLSDTVSQNQTLAATTQAKLRNGRRVRHNMSPNASTDSSAIHGDEDLNHPVPILPAEMAPTPALLSGSHSAITLSPLDLPSDQFRSGLDRRKQNRQLLMDWLRTALVDGVDFGKVHIASKDKCDLARSGRARECQNQWHWSKPSLFKPGAEKISGMLGMTVHYPSLAAYENAFLSGKEVTQVIMRCELQDAHGRVVAEGVGARSLTQDYGDINKALKMAEKSAHIDATLRLAGLSEVFTQDIEDRPIHDDDDVPVAATQKTSRAPSRSSGPSCPPQPPHPTDNGFSPAPRSASPVPANPPPSSNIHEIEIIDADDVTLIRERMSSIGITEKRVLAWLYKVTKGTVTRLEQLNVVQCTSLLKRLDVWANEASVQASAAAA